MGFDMPPLPEIRCWILSKAYDERTSQDTGIGTMNEEIRGV
jgi:hypothetical protein